MKRCWTGLGAAMVAAALAGCDWEAGSGADTVSGRYNWVNFSGVYRATGGTYLVGAFDAGETNNVLNERVATAVAGQSTYAGVLSRRNVRPGTVQIVAGVFVLTDNGAGVLAGSGKTGTIVYSTGAWSIDLLGAWPPAGTPIVASYQWVDTPGGGSTGRGVYSFTVTQSGNVLRITDSNGAVYDGKISSIRSTGGVSSDEPSTVPPQPAVGDVVTASFEAEGRSSAGISVKIVGALNGTVAATTSGGTGVTTATAQIRLTDRTLQGTWIEANGRTGDISGVAD